MPYIHGEKGRETWRQINEAIKECGGKWVSMGKDSHWEIPYDGVKKPRTVNDEVRHEALKMIAELQGAVDVLRDGIKKLEKLTK